MDIVRVVWLDTNECSLSTWQTKQELLDSKTCTISSLGCLIKQDDESITISADKDDLDEDTINFFYQQFKIITVYTTFSYESMNKLRYIIFNMN